MMNFFHSVASSAQIFSPEQIATLLILYNFLSQSKSEWNASGFQTDNTAEGTITYKQFGTTEYLDAGGSVTISGQFHFTFEFTPEDDGTGGSYKVPLIASNSSNRLMIGMDSDSGGSVFFNASGATLSNNSRNFGLTFGQKVKFDIYRDGSNEVFFSFNNQAYTSLGTTSNNFTYRYIYNESALAQRKFKGFPYIATLRSSLDGTVTRNWVNELGFIDTTENSTLTLAGSPVDVVVNLEDELNAQLKTGGALQFTAADTDYTTAVNAGSNKAIEFVIKLDSTTEKLIDLNGTANIEVVGGTITVNNWAGTTIKVDNVVTSTIDTDWHYVIIYSDTAIDFSALRFGLIGATYGNFKIGSCFTHATAESTGRYNDPNGAFSGTHGWLFCEGSVKVGRPIFDVIAGLSLKFNSGNTTNKAVSNSPIGFQKGLSSNSLYSYFNGTNQGALLDEIIELGEFDIEVSWFPTGLSTNSFIPLMGLQSGSTNRMLLSDGTQSSRFFLTANNQTISSTNAVLSLVLNQINTTRIYRQADGNVYVECNGSGPILCGNIAIANLFRFQAIGGVISTNYYFKGMFLSVSVKDAENGNLIQKWHGGQWFNLAGQITATPTAGTDKIWIPATNDTTDILGGNTLFKKKAGDLMFTDGSGGTIDLQSTRTTKTYAKTLAFSYYTPTNEVDQPIFDLGDDTVEVVSKAIVCDSFADIRMNGGDTIIYPYRYNSVILRSSDYVAIDKTSLISTLLASGIVGSICTYADEITDDECVLLEAYLTRNQTWSGGTRYVVFGAGQSNQDLSTPYTEPETPAYLIPDHEVPGVTVFNSTNEEQWDLDHTGLKGNGAYSNPGWGIPVVFLHDLAEERPNLDIMLSQLAVGGTSIYVRSTSLGCWSVDYGAYDGTTPKLTLILEDRVNNMYKWAGMNNIRIIPTLFEWIQGQADKPTGSAAYQANEMAMFTEIRRFIGKPELPIIDATVPSSFNGFDATIKAAKLANAAADANIYCVDFDDLTAFDGAHYDGASAIEGGNRMLTQILAIWP